MKRLGVCLYYKENLLLRHIKTEYFPQCLLCRISIQNQNGYLGVTYRSLSQNKNEFREFLTNFERLLNHAKQLKSSFLIILGDFKARSKFWCLDDITTYEGPKTDSLTTTHGLHQLISQLTPLLSTSSTCIDLIFTDQPNLVVNSGVYPSLHKNCYHKITFCKLNLKIEYLPPYERLVWDYKKADVNSIRKALKQVNWEFLFKEKNVHEQVLILNKTLLNVFSNDVPNKIITFNDKDPQWMTQYLKSQINWRNNVHQEYHRKRNHSADDFIFSENVISEVSELIF